MNISQSSSGKPSCTYRTAEKLGGLLEMYPLILC